MTSKNFFKAVIKSMSLLTFVFFLNACGERKSYIFLVDWTDSVPSSAREKVFESIQIKSQKLGRGDSITIIPITGDGLTESSGKVIRLEAAEVRQLRDKDLKKFRKDIEKKLTESKRTSKTYKQTDIFGALQIAHEEASLRTKEDRKVLIFVFSDMVHSTGEMRFEKDAKFINSETSIGYAKEFSKTNKNKWKNTEIYLGSLESSDLKKMSSERREALREFWREYFKIGNAAKFQYATDGAGQLTVNGEK